MSLSLELVGPHPDPLRADPDDPEFVHREWTFFNRDVPVLMCFGPVSAEAPPEPPPADPPKPSRSRRRARRPVLPALPTWPADDAPGRLNDAKARQALAWIVAGYPKAEIGRALGVSRSVITALAHGRAWAHLPWPPGFAPCRPGCSKVIRSA